jgi:hypothetical protein
LRLAAATLQRLQLHARMNVGVHPGLLAALAAGYDFLQLRIIGSQLQIIALLRAHVSQLHKFGFPLRTERKLAAENNLLLRAFYSQLLFCVSSYEAFYSQLVRLLPLRVGSSQQSKRL